VSIYESVVTIKDPRILPGFKVLVRSDRGYDSPDVSHEVYYDGELIAEFGKGRSERERAIALCQRSKY